jgi:hypothetical protein
MQSQSQQTWSREVPVGGRRDLAVERRCYSVVVKDAQSRVAVVKDSMFTCQSCLRRLPPTDTCRRTGCTFPVVAHAKRPIVYPRGSRDLRFTPALCDDILSYKLAPSNKTLRRPRCLCITLQSSLASCSVSDRPLTSRLLLYDAPAVVRTGSSSEGLLIHRKPSSNTLGTILRTSLAHLHDFLPPSITRRGYSVDPLGGRLVPNSKPTVDILLMWTLECHYSLHFASSAVSSPLRINGQVVEGRLWCPTPSQSAKL